LTIKEIDEGFARLQVEGVRNREEILQMSDIGAKLGTSSLSGHGLSPLPLEHSR